MTETSLSDCPVPELVEALREQATTAIDKNQLVLGLFLNVLAERFEDLDGEIKELQSQLRELGRF